MPTKLKRFMVSLDSRLQGLVEKDALGNRRPVANQILWIIDQYYEAQERQAELFRGNQQPSTQLPGKIPFFETPPPAVEPSAKDHANARPRKNG